MDESLLGKKAEKQVKKWLDRPEEGYCFDRIPDQLTGKYGSKNICDFILYKFPYIYYLESKATWSDRFDFSMLTETQHDELHKKAQIEGVFGYVVVLFATYKRAFLIDIKDIWRLEEKNKHSLNILKIDKWGIPYKEIITVPNNRKQLLDYRNEDNVL